MFLLPSSTWSRKFPIFEFLTLRRAPSRKSCNLCLNTKTIRAKQAKVRVAYFVHCDEHGMIAKHLTERKVLFYFDTIAVAAIVAP